jgi:hypothetical protein
VVPALPELPEPVTQRNPAMPTLLALFMILLGFFIILSMHSQGERARAAAAAVSLAEALGKPSGTVLDGPRSEPFRRSFEGGLAERQLRLQPLGAQDRGAEDGFAAPVNDMFALSRAGLTQYGETVIRYIAQALVENPEGRTWAVEIVMPDDADGLAVQRMAGLARKLAELGVPAAAYSLGISGALRDSVRFSFGGRGDGA